MRTTITLDDDVFNIARQKAHREHMSIGATVSELMRLGIRSAQMPTAHRAAIRSKYTVLPACNETITSEHVYKLIEQERI